MSSQGAMIRILKDSAGVELNVTEKTATFQSEELSIGEFSEFGLMNIWDETAGSGTFDVTPEVSADGGTTWWSMPAAKNSQTAAAMTQITADGKDMKYWDNPLPNHANARLRFVYTAASSPTYNLTSYVFAQKIKRVLDV